MTWETSFSSLAQKIIRKIWFYSAIFLNYFYKYIYKSERDPFTAFYGDNK